MPSCFEMYVPYINEGLAGRKMRVHKMHFFQLGVPSNGLGCCKYDDCTHIKYKSLPGLGFICTKNCQNMYIYM